MAGAGKFSAVDATLGYLYQVRSALLWTLRRKRTEVDFLVSIETIDDVSFETLGGDVTDLLQTKHHQQGLGSLTDASTDLWKTLRVWFEQSSTGLIPKNAALYLVTTSIAPPTSAAAKLRAENRDVPAAQQALDSVISSSSNEANEKAYLAYSNRSSTERTSILERVVILDGSPCVGSLDSELREEIYWATRKENHDAFLERLEGWWLRRVLQQLGNAGKDRINSAELESVMSDLSEQLKQGSLPIDSDLLDFELDEATKTAHEDSRFVWQLEIIKASKKRIGAAIRDYYRACEQRSRWLRVDLVVDMDLHKYEKRLLEEWELVFEKIKDDLGDSAAEEAKTKAARQILAWAESASIPIRPNVTEPFVSRGSIHMLADEAKLGWHPEFRDRLAALLQSGGEAAC
jgi:hypothetical protein